MKQVTYATPKRSDPYCVASQRGDDMNADADADPADTYVLDEDVMEEMENLETTVVLTEDSDTLDVTATSDSEFLEDIEAATDVLNEVFSLVR